MANERIRREVREFLEVWNTDWKAKYEPRPQKANETYYCSGVSPLGGVAKSEAEAKRR
jgi:hypothetical protein